MLDIRKHVVLKEIEDGDVINFVIKNKSSIDDNKDEYMELEEYIGLFGDESIDLDYERRNFSSHITVNTTSGCEMIKSNLGLWFTCGEVQSLINADVELENMVMAKIQNATLLYAKQMIIEEMLRDL